MKLFIIPEKNVKAAEVQIRNLDKRNAKGIRSAFYKIGKDLKTTANKLILKTPRFGKVYFVRVRGRIVRHVASVPGEAPANLTGALRKSLDFNVRGADEMEFGYREGFPPNQKTGIAPKGGVIYGKRLEEGDSLVAQRPGLLLSIKENESNILEHFNKELCSSLNKK